MRIIELGHHTLQMLCREVRFQSRMGFVSDSHKMTALFLAMLVSGFAGTDAMVAFKSVNVKFSLQSRIHIYIILLMKISQFS
jgi:hypothetical protein